MNYHVMRILTQAVILEVAITVHGQAIARRLDASTNTVTRSTSTRTCPGPLSQCIPQSGTHWAPTSRPDTPDHRHRAAAEQHGIRLPAEISASALVLEYPMPPTGGLGIGVNCLVMILTGANIQQTLAFPFVRQHTDLRR